MMSLLLAIHCNFGVRYHEFRIKHFKINSKQYTYHVRMYGLYCKTGIDHLKNSNYIRERYYNKEEK